MKMFRFMKFNILAIIALLFFACSSDDDSDDEDCMKTITLSQYYFYNNQSYSYDITQEVPCDTPEPTEAEEIEPPVLESFNYEVLVLETTTDTGNNTVRLYFEIKLYNPNDYSITGIPFITLEYADGTKVTSTFSNSISNSCNSIGANSSCVLIFDEEDSLDKEIPESIEIVDVQFLLTD
ncbi:hypothetical protein [Zunongwangia endophytica]|nr:hypothetical protein [Zunongwangia endophytica]MDN3595948.1 hypothetical protein [Zunongwangia endophytica]